MAGQVVLRLETKLREERLKDSSTFNKWRLSHQPHAASILSPTIPTTPPAPSPAAATYVWGQATSKYYSLKPSPQLLPQFAESPLAGIVHILPAHYLRCWSLFLRQISSLQSFSYKEPGNKKARPLTNLAKKQGYLSEDQEKVGAVHWEAARALFPATLEGSRGFPVTS